MPRQIKKGPCDQLKSYDDYAQPVKLNFDGGKGAHKSYVGLLITVVSSIIIFYFLLQRIVLMHSKQKITIMEHNEYLPPE